MKYKILWLIINNIQTFDVDFKINLTNQSVNVHVVSQSHKSCFSSINLVLN